MAKLSLTASPTFTASVPIPVPGKKAVPVEFTFRARTRSEFQEWVDSLDGRDNVDVILDIVTGWELEDPFSRETVTQLLESYLGASRVIVETYMSQLAAARLGN